jgi:hypothetical protein
MSAAGNDAIANLTPLTQPAERVQAQLFAAILRNETAVMRKNVVKAEADWRRRCDADGYIDPPDRLVVVQERIEEAVRMLDALNARFLRTK